MISWAATESIISILDNRVSSEIHSDIAHHSLYPFLEPVIEYYTSMHIDFSQRLIPREAIRVRALRIGHAQTDKLIVNRHFLPRDLFVYDIGRLPAFLLLQKSQKIVRPAHVEDAVVLKTGKGSTMP